MSPTIYIKGRRLGYLVPRYIIPLFIARTPGLEERIKEQSNILRTLWPIRFAGKTHVGKTYDAAIPGSRLPGTKEKKKATPIQRPYSNQITQSRSPREDRSRSGSLPIVDRHGVTGRRCGLVRHCASLSAIPRSRPLSCLVPRLARSLALLRGPARPPCLAFVLGVFPGIPPT